MKDQSPFLATNTPMLITACSFSSSPDYQALILNLEVLIGCGG